MKSPVVKRAVVVDGHKTSISIEDDFWIALKEIAQSRNVTLSKLITGIDAAREHSNLSSSIRTFVLEHFRSKSKGVIYSARASLPHALP
jgi:predicted DNA-binding ribbon-helix-helix protein